MLRDSGLLDRRPASFQLLLPLRRVVGRVRNLVELDEPFEGFSRASAGRRWNRLDPGTPYPIAGRLPEAEGLVIRGQVIWGHHTQLPAGFRRQKGCVDTRARESGVAHSLARRQDGSAT
jgi:hypothetical protein